MENRIRKIEIRLDELGCLSNKIFQMLQSRKIEHNNLRKLNKLWFNIEKRKGILGKKWSKLKRAMKSEG